MPITSDQATTKKAALGRSTGRQSMTKSQARKQATHIVSSNKLSPDRQRLIEYLAVAGCMTTTQLKERLGIGLRTLQRCFYDSKTGNGHILDYHRGNSKIVTDYEDTFSVANGLRHIRVWTLGMLGQEIAKNLGFQPVTYNGFAIRQLTHDLLCNAIIFRIIDKSTELGYQWKWLGKNEARIIENRKSIIEPDALLTFTRGDSTYTYCVELHNEHGISRTRKKYRTYQGIMDSGSYTKWGLSTMPHILACGHSLAIINGYAYAMPNANMRPINMYYRTIKSLLTSPDPHHAVDIRRYKSSGTVDRNFDPDAAEVHWMQMFSN